MNMLRTLLLACTVSAASALLAAPAQACKCMLQSVEQAKTQADAIFEGRVTKIEDVPNPTEPSITDKRVTLAIVRVWKALENEESVSVTTAASTASCGYPFEQGGSYLVYAGNSERGYQVGTCSRTRPLADASEDLAALGGGVTPVKVEASAAPVKAPPEPAVAPKSGGCASSSAPAKQSALMFWFGTPMLALAVRRRRD